MSRTDRERIAGEALIDILRDPDQGPAGKTGLSGLIALATGFPCPPRLFDEALEYARHESERRNDEDYGPIAYSPVLDAYGYVGDIWSGALYGQFRSAYSRTRVGHEAELFRQMRAQFPDPSELRDIAQRGDWICRQFAGQIQDVLDDLAAEYPHAPQTIVRLGVNNTLYIVVDDENLALNGASADDEE